MDINVDEDEPCDNYTSKSDGLSKISFSIAAILGGTFGQHEGERKPVKIEPNQLSSSYERTSLFRPFVDYKTLASNPFNISSMNRMAFINNTPTAAFFNNFRLSEIFDSTKYSHPQNPHHHTKSDNNLKHNNATKYPKISDDDIHAQSASKLAPLGGLNKTISQIGQESSANKLSQQQAKVAADITAKNQQQQQHITSSESIESDSNDCNSEASTSTSKDDTKLWPAWVSSRQRQEQPASRLINFLNE